MLGLLRRHTASDSDDRFVVGLAAAFAAGDGSNREGLLRGKNTGVRQSHSWKVRLSQQTIASYRRSVCLQLLPLLSFV